MQRSERIRRLMRLVPWPTLLLAAACGGDKGPTGPDGGDMERVTYDLVSLGRAGLPADAQLEDCTVTRFYSGGLQVTDDGSWQIRLAGPRPGRRLGLRGRRRGRGGRRRVLVRVRRVRLHLSGHPGRLGSDHHVRLVLRRRAGRPAGVRPMTAADQGPRARRSPSRSRPAPAGAATPPGPISRSRRPGAAAAAAAPAAGTIRGRRRRHPNPASRAATCWSRSTNRSRGSW